MLKSPESHLGPLPANVAASGRMNAFGISVFNGATEKTNAISEVRPPVGSYVTLAEFELIKLVRLLYISEFEHISTTRNSYFDPEMVEESSKCQFLNLLVRRLTMPVMPEKQNQDYLVTQVVADYLSQPRFNLDGILFPSAQNAEADKTDAQNVILLYQSSDVMHIETDRLGMGG